MSTTVSDLILDLGSTPSRVVVDDLSADRVDAVTLAGHVAAVCAALHAEGVEPGATIAVRVGQDAASIVALLAAAAYGVAVPVPAGAPTLPHGPFELRAVLGTMPGAPADEGVVVRIDVSDPTVLPRAALDAVPHRAARETAMLLSTSGTTGEPKWVRIGHANLVAAGSFIAGSLRLTPEDRCLSTMPLHHGHGITAGMMAPLLSGGEVVIIDPSDLAFLAEGLHSDITWYSAAPTVHRSLLVARQAWPAWFESFRPRVIRSTSEALPARDKAALESAFGAPVLEAYALTEIPGHVCTQVVGTGTEPGWIPPQDGFEVQTVDAEGRPTEPGVQGRIRFRGPNAMLGYIGHEPFEVGDWFQTSDIGVRRPDGRVFVLGRDSEAIKRGGETIAPAVVESLVEQHPRVERARACGMPHESLGEQICVAVITSNDVAGDDLLRELRTMLPTNLTPSKLRIVDTFPGGTGHGGAAKIRRNDLRPLFAE